MSQPILRFKNVSFAYRRESILHDISFDIEQSGFVSIIGPNGSGKTTALKLASGVIHPQNGCIKFEGTDISHIKRKDISRSIAMVPQEAGVAFPFSVLEIVLMGRAPYHEGFTFENRGDIEIAKNALHATDITHLAERDIDELSGGEKQRVWIARALAQEPKLFLLDEPTAFLDLHHQFEIYELLQRLNAERGITVINVSHDINMAARFSKQLLLLNNGRVEHSGTPAEVVTEEHMASVYRTVVKIEKQGESGSPFIIPQKRTDT